MAIRIATAYANAIAPNADYPGGSFKNKSAPAATDGTPLEKQWANDLYGFGEALLAAAGVTHSDAPDTAVASDRMTALMVLLRRFGTPAGAVEYFAMNSAPDGWLIANGQAVSRTTYADLFAAIGTSYGAGNGTTTFNVPDLRGEFIRCLDNNKGTDPQPTRAVGSSQTDDFKAHVHSAGVDANSASGAAVITGGAQERIVNGQTGSTGGTETRPRNVALLACIKW